MTLPLVTERLLMRLHREDDLDALLAIYSDPDVARYLLEDPWTRESAEDQMPKRLGRTGPESESGALALVIEHEGRVIGDIAIWTTDETRRKVEIGWVIAPHAAGHGFATEAARGLTIAAFRAYDLHRLEAQLDARNAASARVCERVGLVREAHLRQNWWSKGEWTDTLIFGLLASEVSQLGPLTRE